MRRLFLVSLLCSQGLLLRAEFTYQETTQMTGGSMLQMLKLAGPFAKQAREPNVSTHLLKGDRMATVSKDRTSIIDLGKETITDIDFAKKTYTVMTFAEMKQATEDAMNRVQSKGGDTKTEAQFKVSAKATGQTKTIQGLTAKELQITMEMEATDQKSGQKGAMNVNMDNWMAVVPGYDEVREFYRKMGEKMGYLAGSGMSQMAMTQPQVAQGMAAAAKEMQKLDGMPVQSVMKMGGTGDGQGAAAGTDSASQSSSSSSSASSSSSSSKIGKLPGGLGGLAGGFGGLGRKKTPAKEEAPSSDSKPDAAPADSGTLIEMTTELTSYSSGPVDASKFEVPSGFKQAASPLSRKR